MPTRGDPREPGFPGCFDKLSEATHTAVKRMNKPGIEKRFLSEEISICGTRGEPEEIQKHVLIVKGMVAADNREIFPRTKVATGKNDSKLRLEPAPL